MEKPLLVVDDQRTIVLSLEVVFKRSGFHVLTACSGAEALELVERHGFSAALIDVNMPGMSGFDLCRTLCSQARDAGRRVPPIWMMSGAYSAASIRTAVQSGAIGLLPKPFDFRAVLRDVNDALSASHDPFGAPTDVDSD